MANIANLITKLTGIIASLDDIRDAISQGGGGSSTASGVTVTPAAPLTGTNLQATTNETAALLQEHTNEISTLNSSKQDLIKYKTESLTFTSGHREVRLSDLGITVNHLINVYSYSTGYDITFNYEANGTVNMVCRSDTAYSGNLNVIIVYV